MTGKVYQGDPDTMAVHVHMPDGSIRHLDPRFDLAQHSPDGFNWGFAGGSGPAQLSLALCADVLQDDGRALAIYQTFKRAFVAKLETVHGWRIGEEELDQSIKETERDFVPSHL